MVPIANGRLRHLGNERLSVAQQKLQRGPPYSVLQLIGEVGTDLSVWPSEKHFTAWAAPPITTAANVRGGPGVGATAPGNCFA